MRYGAPGAAPVHQDPPPGATIRSVDQRLRRLWISAIQSRIFNDVLAARIGQIDQVVAGDVAYKHENGACFVVENAAEEQPRCAAFQISPTGPLIGYRMTPPTGEPLAIEEAAFARAHLAPADFRRTNVLKVKGARRPLRVRPADIDVAGGVDEHGSFVTLAFTLPAGSFATMLLREVMKSELLKRRENADVEPSDPDDENQDFIDDDSGGEAGEAEPEQPEAEASTGAEA